MIGKYPCQNLHGGWGAAIRQDDGLCNHPECKPEDESNLLKPRRAKCKLTRTVTEIVIAILDKDGNVEEIEEVHEEQNYEVTEIHAILTVLSVRP